VQSYALADPGRASFVGGDQPDDLEMDTYRGPLNDNAVRITHKPSGVCVSSDDLPTSEQNHEAAMRLLQDALDA
jgi:protein subunit release factor A